ncbi:biotin attachment protein, partial [Pelagibacterales bacterium]|nr:biotin attachment protein [Pelagibacterales bacterium]
MSIDIKVPSLGESVTEATIARWYKNVGDSVTIDEPLLEL